MARKKRLCNPSLCSTAPQRAPAQRASRALDNLLAQAWPLFVSQGLLRASSLAASTKSLSVKPSILWVQMTTFTLPQAR